MNVEKISPRRLTVSERINSTEFGRGKSKSSFMMPVAAS